MIKITIYEKNIENIGDARGYLRKFANANNMIIQENVYFKVDDMVEQPVDVCLIDYKAFLEEQEILLEWQKIYHMKFIFVTSDIKDIIDIMQSHPEHYLILSPIEEESLLKVFNNLKSRIRKKAIIVKLAHSEDQRIYIKDLNYINILNRNLCYHLSNGKEYESQTLRKSFVKEIEPLLVKPGLFLIQPSLLINLTNVETLWADHLRFENGDVIYFPKTAYDRLKEAWKNYYI